MQEVKCLGYRITTLSPLLLAGGTGDPNMVATKENIPGTCVLGALAQRFISKRNLGMKAHEDDVFFRWFLKGDVRFSNAYIATRLDDMTLKCNYPIPLSIHEDKESEGDLYDLLLDDPEKVTKWIKGFGRIEGQTLYTQEVKKSLNFHHERDSFTGTTREGMIFNYESLDAGQTFEGTIMGSEQDLKQLTTTLGSTFETRIGRSRSAQYGRISYTFLDMKDCAVTPTVKITSSIILTLLSDAIVYNEMGMSTTDLEVLEAHIKTKLGSAVFIENAFVKTIEIENFVSAWKLRKPSEACFSMGSCIFLKGISANDPRLAVLEKSGIGEKTNEGFGQVSVGLHDSNALTKGEVNSIGEPIGTSMPEITKKIAHEAVRDYILSKIAKQALLEQKKFNHLPSKSLISRLEMALTTRNRGEFDGYIEQLRKPAMDSLTRCHNDEKTLLEFLAIKVEEAVVNEHYKDASVRTTCDLIGFVPMTDPAFMQEVFRVYWETILTAMRRRKGKEDE
jgi:CRISPR-associated protein Csx10